MTTPSDVQSLIQQCIQDCAKEYQGSYREICIGIEAMCQELKDNGVFVTRFALDFYQDGFQVSGVEVAEKKPENFNLEGMWTVLYSAVCPRYTPFGPDPLRVSRLEVGYGMDPRVSYDSTHDNGLPMAFNRRYNPDKLKANQER